MIFYKTEKQAPCEKWGAFYFVYIIYISTLFSRREFKTTLILEKAIAAAAKTGLSRRPKNG